jgi:type IV pilus assembly protein PilB
MIVAQRLVRKLCPDCKQPQNLDAKVRADFGITAPVVYQANEKGCKTCRNIGYWGRLAIYEILPIDEELRGIIAKGGDLDLMRAMQKKKGCATLFQSGITKVNEGLTSLEEVMGIAYV